MFHRLSIQAAAELTLQQFDGDEYLVFPMIALKEGVIHSANAETADFVPYTEIEKSVASWNGRPITFNHPQDANGNFISANSPETLEATRIGFMFNSVADDQSLKSEAWIRKDLLLAQEGGQDVLDKLEAGDMVEVSTGLFTQLMDLSGSYNGKNYVHTWQSIFPDHLAILEVGVTGACSNADGCGIPRINQDALVKANTSQMFVNSAAEAPKVTTTECSGDCGEECCGTTATHLTRAHDLLANAISNDILFGDIVTAGSEALRVHHNTTDVWVMSATTEHLIYEMWLGGWKYFRIPYDADELGVITLTGEPELVRLLTKVVVQTENGEATMPNTQNAEAPAGQSASPENTSAQPTASAAPVEPTPAAPTASETNVQDMGVDDYIAGAPDHLKPLLEAGMATYNTLKANTVGALVANTKCQFTEDDLKGMDLQTLQKIAAMSEPVAVVDNTTQTETPAVNATPAKPAAPTPVADYSGQAPAVQPTANTTTTVDKPQSAFHSLRAQEA